MCWKQLSKSQKALYLILIYLTVYLVVSYAITPEPEISFISEEFRVGAKYMVMFLVAPNASVFSDRDGANVFAKCGKCFITNNKGFLPMSEYDAILIQGERSLLSQTTAFMDPQKRYLIETRKECLRRKFRGCIVKPIVTSFSTRETYDLCGLCKKLLTNNMTKS